MNDDLDMGDDLKISKEYAEHLMDLVRDERENGGIDISNWTREQLDAYLTSIVRYEDD